MKKGGYMLVKIHLSPEFHHFTVAELTSTCPGIFDTLHRNGGESILVPWDGRFESLPQDAPAMVFVNIVTGTDDSRMGEFASRCSLRGHFVFAHSDYTFDQTGECVKYHWASLKRFLDDAAKKIVIPFRGEEAMSLPIWLHPLEKKGSVASFTRDNPRFYDELKERALMPVLYQWDGVPESLPRTREKVVVYIPISAFVSCQGTTFHHDLVTHCQQHGHLMLMEGDEVIDANGRPDVVDFHPTVSAFLDSLPQH